MGFFPPLGDKWNTLFSYSTAQSFSLPLSLSLPHTHSLYLCASFFYTSMELDF